jgi:hypothetical protein
MNDHVASEDLAAYVDGRLSIAKKKELESHFSRCPACLDELAEVAAIVPGRDEVPAQFLRQALGENSRTARPVLSPRLVFEVAAAVVAVVFIGYFFLGHDHSWQNPELQKTTSLTEKNIPPAVPADSLRGRKSAQIPEQRQGRAEPEKAINGRPEAETDRRPADAAFPEKKGHAAKDKGPPAGSIEAMENAPPENKFLAIGAEPPKTTTAGEGRLKEELDRTAAAPPIVGGVQADFAAKEQPAASVMDANAGSAKRDSQKQNHDEAGAAPAPRASPIRVEGDVGWADLRNPEIILAWTWFPKGLALELRIDVSGTVTAAVALGKTDAALAGQAESEARKLMFSVSKKKSRRARLVAD